MKTCSTCNTEKKESEFYSRKDRKSGQAMCKQCFNSYCIERWKERKKQAVSYLGGKCVDCNKVYHPNVFEFHHLRDKDASWNKVRLWSWNRIKNELDKCVLLCANCHRIRHIALSNWAKGAWYPEPDLNRHALMGNRSNGTWSGSRTRTVAMTCGF